MSHTYRHYKFNPTIQDVDIVLYQLKPNERLYKVVPFDMYTWVAIFEADDPASDLVVKSPEATDE